MCKWLNRIQIAVAVVMTVATVAAASVGMALPVVAGMSVSAFVCWQFCD